MNIDANGIELILKILVPVVSVVFAYVVYVEKKLRDMNKRLEEALSKKDVQEMQDSQLEVIELKLKVQNVKIDELKEDIRDIKGTTDRVLDILLRRP